MLGKFRGSLSLKIKKIIATVLLNAIKEKNVDSFILYFLSFVSNF